MRIVLFNEDTRELGAGIHSPYVGLGAAVESSPSLITDGDDANFPNRLYTVSANAAQGKSTQTRTAIRLPYIYHEDHTEVVLHGLAWRTADISGSYTVRLYVDTVYSDQVVTTEYANPSEVVEITRALAGNGFIEGDNLEIRVDLIFDVTSFQDEPVHGYLYMPVIEVDTMVDSGSSTDDLDDVCDRGATTDQIITAAGFRSNGNIEVNYDGVDGNSFIYFYEGASPRGAFLQWVDAYTGFYFSKLLVVNGDIRANSNVHINYDGADTSTEMQFTLTDGLYKDSDNTPTSSVLTTGIAALVNGNLATEAVAFSVNKDSVGFDLGVSKTVTRMRRYDGNSASDNIYTGGGFDSLAIYSSDDNSTWTLHQTYDPVVRIDTGSGNVHYVELTLTTPAAARYWKMHAPENAIAAFNGDQLNCTEVEAWGYPNPDEDGFLYFFEGGSPTGAHLKWDDVDDRFEFSEALFVNGVATASELRSNGSIYANYDGPNGNAHLYFYNSTPTGSYLQWNNGVGQFIMNQPLTVTGDLTATGALLGTSSDVSGEARCDSLRIDQTPSTTASPMVSFDDYILVNLNGTSWRIPVFPA